LKSSAQVPPSRVKSRGPTPTKTFNRVTTPKSATRDKINPIYEEKDPIKASIAKRIEAGTILSQVKGERQPDYFWELKLVGDGLQNPKKNEMVPKKKRRSVASENRSASVSPSGRKTHKEAFSGMSRSDPIGKAMKERSDAGNILTVVPNAETHQPMPRTATLKLRSDYTLRENAKNKQMQKLI
jgi:hypothetical protein